METLTPPATWMSPLRSAAIYAFTAARGAAVGVQVLAVFAQVDLSRAKSYATILVNGGVLIDTPEGLAAGPKWSEWSRQACKSRPVSGDADGDAINQIQRGIRSNLLGMISQRGLSLYEAAKRAGIPYRHLHRLQSHGIPLSAAKLVLLAQVLGLDLCQICQPIASPSLRVLSSR